MNLKNLTQSLSFLSKFSYGKRVHPVRDWMAVLSAVFLGIVLSVAWNLWMFISPHTSIQTAATEATSTPTLSTDTLAAAKSVFANRAAEAEHFKSDYHFPDPSIPIK